MKRDIHLPSGAIKEVELQYEKLDKHCFKCKSLTHEDSHCPSKVPADLRGKGPSSMDTSPRNTINRLEERKHKYHERQQAKVDTFVKHATQQKLQWPHSSSSIRGEERWVAKGTSNEQTPRRSFHSETHSRDGHSRLGSLQYYRSEYRSRPDGRETRSPPPSWTAAPSINTRHWRKLWRIEKPRQVSTSRRICVSLISFSEREILCSTSSTLI
ncbi:Zinc knuckle CX2CX4HX4C protein [Raphanus sativus]|nr:Zinc knuckle CX2CX4HX4C protein [Raphanus sativus]